MKKVAEIDVKGTPVRARYTLEFLGTWKLLHNPSFKVVEFDHFKCAFSRQGLIVGGC